MRLLACLIVLIRAQTMLTDRIGPCIASGALASTARVRRSDDNLLLGHDRQQGRAELALSKGNLGGLGRCGGQGLPCGPSGYHDLSVRLRAEVAQGHGLGFVTLGLAHDRREDPVGPWRGTWRGAGLLPGLGAEHALCPHLLVVRRFCLSP